MVLSVNCKGWRLFREVAELGGATLTTTAHSCQRLFEEGSHFLVQDILEMGSSDPIIEPARSLELQPLRKIIELLSGTLFEKGSHTSNFA